MPTSETAISALLRMVSVACFWSLSGHRSCFKKHRFGAGDTRMAKERESELRTNDQLHGCPQGR